MPGKPIEPNPWFLSRSSLSIRAWSLLKDSGNLKPELVARDGLRFGLPWVRIWADPSGFAYRCEPMTLTVFHPFRAEDQPLVPKAVWESRRDCGFLHELVDKQRRPVSFEPTITVQDKKVPAVELDTILRSGLGIAVPLLLLKETSSVTSDAGSMGAEFFTLDQPAASVSLAWSFDPPNEWRDAIEFVGRLKAFLESMLEEAS